MIYKFVAIRSIKRRKNGCKKVSMGWKNEFECNLRGAECEMGIDNAVIVKCITQLECCKRVHF